MLWMRNIWSIFTRDMKNISTNWITAVIIGGLIFLPSLYAWLNISASWDPYGQTNQMPVAVVNEDAGDVIRGESIDVGDELVDTLKDNDSMDWQFTDRESAISELEKGDLFAVLMIPEDFSKKLGTVTQSHPEKANIEYYVNEKINAIAPKITEKGASVIVEDISSQFISTVNGIIFNLFNEIGLELEAELPDIEQFEEYIFEMEERLPSIHETLKESLSDATDAQNIVGKVQKQLPKASEVVDSGLETVDQTYTLLENAETRLQKIGPEIQSNLENAQENVAQINKFIREIERADIDFDTVDTEIDHLEKQVDQSLETIETIEKGLQDILKQMEKAEVPDEKQMEKLATTIAELHEIHELLLAGQENTEKITDIIEENETEIEQLMKDISDLSIRVGDRLDDFVQEYNESIEPMVMKEVSNMKSTLSRTRGMLVDVEETIPEISQLLDRTNGNLDDGGNLLEDVLGEYPYVNDKITELADRIREIQEETDIHEIIELLQNDPEAEEGFFSEPVQLTENKVFPIENYGSGMTPFYTVLSLWVGGLLLISILSTDVQQPSQFNPREIYFGKICTFILIGFLQTLIVTMGDVFIIEVNMAHPVWFVFFGLFVSGIFMTMIYTFVSIFGDVGKAIAIVLLVLQIAGSGGTYPVVLLPKFFQMISPFLPFTYAVDLMREAVGGIVWSNVLLDLFVLSIFCVIAVIFGTLLKEPINNHTKKLMDQSKESGVFH